MAAPIVISLQLAWRQSLASEESRVSGYAHEALRRGNEAGSEMQEAFWQLSHSKFARCSPQDMDAMRRVAMESDYLHGVSRISGDTISCSSLGTTEPIPLGKATLSTESGVRDWLNLRIPLSGGRPIAVVAEGDVALLLDPQLPLDTYTEGPDIALAMYFPSIGGTPNVIARHGFIRPDWYRDVPRGSTVTFVDAGHVVSVARGMRGDIATVAAAPESYIVLRVWHFAEIFIPIGVVCGLVLAWAVWSIGRAQLSFPAALRNAARRREFFVEYQPIVDLQSRRCVGAEALVRWQRGSEVVSPDVFIPAAEESGVITAITERVAELVARDLPALLHLDPDFCVSINLSAADLSSEHTSALLIGLLRNSGARPKNLQV